VTGLFADLAVAALTGARWYAGKGRPVRLVGIAPLAWTAAPGDAALPAGLRGVRPVLVTVAHDDVDPPDIDIYQFLVTFRPTGGQDDPAGALGTCRDPDVTGSGEEVLVVDATRDPEAMRVALQALARAGGDRRDAPPSPPARTGTVHDHLLFPLPQVDLTPHPFEGQQSNSSVFFGDHLVLKVFRRLGIGRNPDIAVHAALSREAGVGVARLYGWADAQWVDDGTELSADLAMLVERFPGARDGWDLAGSRCRAGEDFSTEAAELGAALRRVHAGLAARFPTATEPASRVAAAMVARLERACRMAPELAPYAPGLTDILTASTDRQLPIQHIHGDFHLGQALRVSDAQDGTHWRIIDFEGEPMVPLAERWRPDSPWRDVAGLIRSIRYASSAPAGDSDAPAREAWAHRAQQAFLAAYCDGAPDPDDLDVLRAYIVDKAVYEVVYEVRNRPAWAGIPLRAVAELAGSRGDRDFQLPSTRRDGPTPTGEENQD